MHYYFIIAYIFYFIMCQLINVMDTFNNYYNNVAI